MAKGIIALSQLYSVVNYIRDERERIRDYAAYQLTVIPHGLRSVDNILCGLVTPTYSAVYMVDSATMEDARGRGWAFGGTIGELCYNENNSMPLMEGSDIVGYLATFEEGWNETGMSYGVGGVRLGPRQSPVG
jgi:hypothetical protein